MAIDQESYYIKHIIINNVKKHITKQTKKAYKTGFTLIELAVVITVLSILATGVLTLSTGSFNAAKVDTTKERLDVIENALLAFVKDRGRLPCPAGPLIPYDDTADFGVETGNRVNYENNPATQGNNEKCHNGKANDSGKSSTQIGVRDAQPFSRVQLGIVPVRTLGLPSEYAFDGWGNKFTYVVDDDFTRTFGHDLSSGHGFGMADQDNPVLEVRSESGNDDSDIKTEDAVYVIISHGRNGIGSYRRVTPNSTTNAAFNGTRSNNTEERDNMGRSASGALSLDRVFVDAPINEADGFDDIVRYKTHIQIGAKTKGEKRAETVAKMQTIEDATYKFVAAHGVLPCAADDLTGLPDATGSGTCQVGETQRESFVPYVSLGIDEDYAFDGWGRPMQYRTHPNLVDGINNQRETDNFYSVDDPDPATTGSEEDNIGFIILSHGYNVDDDIFGRYLDRMDQLNTTRIEESFGDEDGENEDFDDRYEYDPSDQRNDDIIRYYRRSDILLNSCNIRLSEACVCESIGGYNRTVVGLTQCRIGDPSRRRHCGMAGIWSEEFDASGDPSTCP